MNLDFSYQEKSLVGSLIAILVVYGHYFTNVLKDIGRGNINGDILDRLISTVVVIVAIEIAYHIILAVLTKPELDERDARIEVRAYRNAYMALTTGASLVLCYFIVAALVSNGPRQLMVTPFLLVNLLLFFMVLAEVSKLITQLLYYRKGF